VTVRALGPLERIAGFFLWHVRLVLLERYRDMTFLETVVLGEAEYLATHWIGFLQAQAIIAGRLDPASLDEQMLPPGACLEPFDDCFHCRTRTLLQPADAIEVLRRAKKQLEDDEWLPPGAAELLEAMRVDFAPLH
jgi:hypothetical protein